MRRDWGAAAVLLGVALVAAGAPMSSDAAAQPGPALRLPPTPILSARRDAGWLDATVAHQRLAARLSSIPAGPPGTSACVEVIQDGDPLYGRNATEPLLPASNLKVITAYAGLELLGAGTRFTTVVKGVSGPHGGTLSGNLYLVGGGDPNLMTDAYDHTQYFPHPVYTSLDAMAAAVKAAGIRFITGSVVGDAHRYDSLVGVPTWSPSYLTEGDVGPLSALEVDDGSPPPAPPSKTGTKATQPPSPGPADPTLFAAQTFKAVLEAHGVDVEGSAEAGRAPASGVVITSAVSPALGDEVEQMLRVSDDTAAELLTKEIGYRLSGQGSTAAGAAAIGQRLAADGLPAGQLVILDGSGLDRGDRATCAAIASVLERGGQDGAVATGLPVAGQTGTLTRRLRGTQAAGRLRAKTGTLDGVSSLSGLIEPPSGASTPELDVPLYFSLIVNGSQAGDDETYLDRIAIALADYPDTVPLAELEPAG